MPSVWVTTLFIIVLAVVTFLPFPFIHPVRVRRFRKLNLSLLVIGCVLAFVAIACNMAPPAWVTGVLCVLGAYMLGGGVLRGAGRAYR